MKFIFKFHEVWDIVHNGYKEPTEEEEVVMKPQKNELNETRKQKYLKALSFIHSVMNGQNMFDSDISQRQGYP